MDGSESIIEELKKTIEGLSEKMEFEEKVKEDLLVHSPLFLPTYNTEITS